MKLDLTPLLECLQRIESKLDKILEVDIKPPTVTPTPIEPEKPIQTETDITNIWYHTFKNGSGELILNSGQTYTLNTVKRQKINGKVRIKTTDKEPAFIWIGKENYTLYVDKGEDTILFDLQNGADVFIENINVSLRPQNRNVQQMYSVNWFTSVQNPDAKWRAVIKNCDAGKNGGFGTGTVYGGTKQNNIALINYKHSGPMLLDLKNPYKEGVLIATLQNVSTDYKNASDWSKRAFLTKGMIGNNNVLTLIGDVETSCLYNHFFITDKGSNRSFLAHIGRFTFMVDTIDAEIDRNRLQLRPAPKSGEKVFVKGGRFFFNNREPHAGDSFVVNEKSYTIKSKDKTEWDEWTNEWKKGKYPQIYKSTQCRTIEQVDLKDGEYTLSSYKSTFNQYNVEQPIYLIYKDDLFFGTTLNTKFGDYQVLRAREGGHIAYNHRSVSIWADNVTLDGYYRESTQGEGKALFYNIKNSVGFDDEFSDKEITTNLPMPKEISELL